MSDLEERIGAIIASEHYSGDHGDAAREIVSMVKEACVAAIEILIKDSPHYGYNVKGVQLLRMVVADKIIPAIEKVGNKNDRP